MNQIEEYTQEQWEELVLKVSKEFNVTADFDFMLFIIGIQERGLGFRHYSREEKFDLINLGKCTIFESIGYLKASNNDQQGWPVFEVIKNINTLTPSMQKHLLMKGMFNYYNRVMN